MSASGRREIMNGKRIFSVLLIAILCFSFASAAFAAEEEPLVICLDPGHGARDSGAVAAYDGVEHQGAELVLRVGLERRGALGTYG